MKTEQEKSDKLLTVEQIHERLNCSRRHVYNLIEQGKLPGFRIGNKNGLRVRESNLEAFIQQRVYEEGLL